MNGKSELHFSDEFVRTKRNLLWVCSFAFLLWLVEVPPAGMFDSPMIGSSAKIGIKWLQFAAWLACLYNFIGFWRHIRHVDRLNSKALYTQEFENLGMRLRALEATFIDLTEATENTRNQITALNPLDEESTDTITAKIVAGIAKELSYAEDKFQDWKDDPSKRSSLVLDEAFSHLRQKLYKPLKLFTEDLRVSSGTRHVRGYDLFGLVEQAKAIGATIERIHGEFKSLSYEIHVEHRLMYSWYDNRLTVVIFLFVTVASFWNIVGDAWHHIAPYAGI